LRISAQGKRALSANPWRGGETDAENQQYRELYVTLSNSSCAMQHGTAVSLRNLQSPHN
jgi:hypothetical protein